MVNQIEGIASFLEKLTTYNIPVETFSYPTMQRLLLRKNGYALLLETGRTNKKNGEYWPELNPTWLLSWSRIPPNNLFIDSPSTGLVIGLTAILPALLGKPTVRFNFQSRSNGIIIPDLKQNQQLNLYMAKFNPRKHLFHGHCKIRPLSKNSSVVLE